jgi:hypothetical protein
MNAVAEVPNGENLLDETAIMRPANGYCEINHAVPQPKTY